MSGPARSPAALAPLEVDVAIVGSGAAGLSAALTAAAQGLKVAVFEKHAQLGGTSAWCSGWMWIPGSGLEGGADGDPKDALRYLRAELGKDAMKRQRALVKAYLKGGPRMLAFFASRFPDIMQFELDRETPDFHAVPGQHLGGRMVRAKAFDGRHIGAQIERLRRPLPEFTFMGMAIEAGADLNAFLTASRSLRSFGRVLGRVAGHLQDLLTWGRGMRLVNGNALMARMLACAAALEAQALDERAKRQRTPLESGDFERLRLFTDHEVLELRTRDAAVVGLKLRTPDGEREVRAGLGVILAGGGFPHDPKRIRDLFPPALHDGAHRSAAPVQNTGDGLRLGEQAGGRIGTTLTAAAFTPVSVRRRRDGSTAVYPHFIERAKPGVIAVLRDGRRFCNEAVSYHEFMGSWLRGADPNEPLQAWLIGDLRSLFLFGLGMVKPATPLPLDALCSGYLKHGLTLESLARNCGIDAQGLRAQVERYNAQARIQDPQFLRGESAYDRSQGDPLTAPNPCVGPIDLPPYFAVRLQAGSLGTLAGLQTDEHARVLDAAGQPIAGLYASGNDMAAVLGGHYPTNGVTLASAMIFGHLAARHMVRSHDAPRRPRRWTTPSN